jgi:hypothetical protein
VGCCANSRAWWQCSHLPHLVHWRAQVWDADSNNQIDQEEFRRYIRATHRGDLSSEALKYVAEETFRELDTDGKVCVVVYIVISCAD